MSSILPCNSFLVPTDECFDGYISRINYADPELVLEEVLVHEVKNETLGFSRLYTNDGDGNGKLIVLTTNYYGSGWSTEIRTNHSKQLLMDARIVRFFYKTYIVPLHTKPRTCECGLVCGCSVDQEPMRKFLKELGIETEFLPSLGSLKNLSIEFVPPNKKFRVSAYDGLESIEVYNEEYWILS